MRIVFGIAGSLAMFIALPPRWLAGAIPSARPSIPQVLLFTGGLFLLSIAILDRKTRLIRHAARPLLLGISIYIALLCCQLAAFSWLPRTKNPQIAMRGLVRQDERIGYTLSPNWDGYYDDGRLRIRIRTNSRGHRDDEPSRGSPRRRILLLGDSFTFGHMLDQGSGTIDKWVEKLSKGDVDAYNTGVGGYGPPAILETLKRCDWFEGHHVFYLFFNNDLRDDNLLPDMGFTCFAGYAVPKAKEDGTPFSKDEHLIAVREILREPEHLPAASLFLYALKLRGLRDHAARWKKPEDIEARLLSGGKGDFHAENIAKALNLTRSMQAIASRRRMRFHVVIIPTMGETMLHRYSTTTSNYVSELRKSDIPVVEIIDRLSVDDYFPNDGHFDPSGARHAAEAILEAMSEKTQAIGS